MAIIKSLVLALVIFAGLLIGLSQIYQQSASSYGQTNTTDWSSETNNPTNSINGTMTDISNRMTNIAQPGLNPGLVLNPVMLLIDIVNMIGKVPGMVMGIITQISESTMGLPIPSWLYVMIGVIILAVFVFALLSWITGREM